MDSTIVIKVKYEKTLRRFNASVVDGRLVLDMAGLRAKVLHLFNLTPDSELTLRYTDEDGDVVTLADEEDLVDVVKQSLNPLRITVKLTSENTVKSNSSGSSTPTVSPQTQQPRDILMSLLHEAAKLKKDHKNSPQALTELVDSFRKQVAEFQASAESSPKSGGTSGSNPELPVNKYTKGSSNPKVGPSANSNSGVTNLKDRLPKASLHVLLPSANSNSEVTNLRDQLQKAGLVVPPPPLDLNVKAPECHFTAWPNVPSDKSKEKKKSKKYPAGSSHIGPNRVSECPFSGDVAGNYSGYPLRPQYAPQVFQVPSVGSSNPSDGPRRIFHDGVECDGCGAHPIVGTRFKSIVKHDYDLCSTCFAKEGNERNYVRLDWPVPLQRALQSVYYTQLQQRSRMRQAPPPPQVSTGAGTKGGDLKLDSCFMQDVNILDGTIMSPSTPFTKIWRMKNNGTTVWPRGTCLMWIGGDKFSNTVSVELEIPTIGLPMEEELDVAIDFCAPELPGRYISYWRMASPSGQKFGQRVWVLIQVDASLTDPELPRDPRLQNTLRFNLNLPPTNSINAPQIVNVNVDEPMVKNNSPAEPERSNKGTELVEPLLEANTGKDQELSFPINDTLLVGGDASKVPTSPAEASSSSFSTVSYPVVDLSKVDPIALYTSPAATNLAVPSTLTTTPAQLEDGKNEVEQKLLRELEEMGFKRTDLNKEILRKNEYNLQQSVDDLCGVEEWDPILDELKEMGFCNDEVNKRLLKKNNGSIKRVVMDLINGE